MEYDRACEPDSGRRGLAMSTLQARASRLAMAAGLVAMMSGIQEAAGQTVVPVIEEAVLADPELEALEDFGYAIALDGDTAVIGAPKDSVGDVQKSGSAHVFVRSATTWTHQQTLVASDASTDSLFGDAVALDGDFAVIGARLDNDAGVWDAGSAYVFVRNGSIWTEQSKLKSPTPGVNFHMGTAVAVAGDTAIVGIPNHYPGGLALVFARKGGTWILEATLEASDAGVDDELGSSAALLGDMAFVGAPGDSLPGIDHVGSVRVFLRNGTTWSEQATLLPPDPLRFDLFGRAVSVTGNLLAIGALRDEFPPVGAGAVYVFRWNGSTWLPTSQLVASDASMKDALGASVSAWGHRIVAGAPADDHGDELVNAGSAYVFVWQDGAWREEAKLIIPEPAAFDLAGEGVAVWGDTVLVGRPDADLQGQSSAGDVHVYRLIGAWADFGGGLAGVGGIPALQGYGLLAEGTATSLSLTHGAPSSPALLLVSLASGSVPFKGGLLQAFPIAAQVPLVTSPTGDAWLSLAAWPDDVPAGFEFFVQGVVADPSAVAGVAISNFIGAVQP